MWTMPQGIPDDLSNKRITLVATKVSEYLPYMYIVSYFQQKSVRVVVLLGLFHILIIKLFNYITVSTPFVY